MRKFILQLLITLICISTSTLSIQAQKKRITTQTATTDNGKKVILKSNGTWKYAPKQSTSTKGKADSVLSIETGLVFRSGDVKPLARTKFYILDDSLVSILRNANLTPPSSLGRSGETDRDYISGFAFSYKYPSSSTYKQYYPKAIEALKPHIVQSVTTDFGGKAEFPAVPSGSYYIMGLGNTPRGFVIWNLKVDLSKGNNPIVLDQNNAEIAL